jgi:hypothetical protein
MYILHKYSIPIANAETKCIQDEQTGATACDESEDER